MAASSRITTGFHRLGIVLSTPFLVAGVVLAFFEWKSPSGPVKAEIPEGASAYQFDEADSDAGEIITAQRFQGFDLPRNWMLIGVPIGPITQDGKEWTKFKLADGREIGIASNDNKKLADIARTFLLDEKRSRHQYTDTDKIEIDGVPIKFLNVFDQYPPTANPWLVKGRDWTLALGSLFAGVAIYVIIWELGWVIRGFSKPT
jgi:hypothetical protein